MNVVVIALVIGLVGVGVASVAPLPNSFNVDVSVTTRAIALLLATDYAVTGVSGTTLGQSTLLDWGVAGLAWGGLYTTFTMTVCVGSGHCATKSASVWFQSVPVVNGESVYATNDFKVGYVPGGEQPISVTFTGGGQTATGSGTMCVGC